MGKSMREACPRNSHATWTAPSDRPDPLSLVLKADAGASPSATKGIQNTYDNDHR